MIALPWRGEHTVELEAEERLRLEEAPSTGYSWEVELPAGWSVAADEWGPALPDDADNAEAFNEEAIMSGVRVLSFAAAEGAAPGTATLRYRRSWESEPPLGTITVQLRR